jgi:hypothetical protein
MIRRVKIKTTGMYKARWVYSCTLCVRSHLTASLGLPTRIYFWTTHQSTKSASVITAHYPATTLCRNPYSKHYFPPQPLPAHINPTDLSPAHTNPTDLSPAHTNPTDLSPAHTNPTDLSPAHTNPTDLSPAHTNPTDLNPHPQRWCQRFALHITNSVPNPHTHHCELITKKEKLGVHIMKW